MQQLKPEYVVTKFLDMLELYSREEALKILNECIHFVDVRTDLFK